MRIYLESNAGGAWLRESQDGTVGSVLKAMARKKDPLLSLLSLPYVEPIDGKPYVRLPYRDARTGKRRSATRRVKSFEDYPSALEYVRRKIGLQTGDYDPEKMTFDELIMEFRKAKPKMPDWYAAPLAEHFGKRRIKTITYGDLKQFKEWREQEVNKSTGEARKPATINHELEWLRAVLLYAVRHDWLGKSPFNKGDEPLISRTEEESRDRIPSPEEEARILAGCIGPRERLRPILIALRDTGLRKGALLSLTWRSADMENGFLEIPKGKVNKGRPKLIAMTARLKDELSIQWEKSANGSTESGRVKEATDDPR